MFFSFSKLHGVFVLTALPITLITGLPAAFSTNLSSQSYDEIYVFGDSLSDVDNVFDATRIPPFSGRASNGLSGWNILQITWNSLHQLSLRWCHHGSDTPPFLVCRVYQDCSSRSMVLQQLIRPLTRTRYIVWAGANDYLNAGIE